MTARHIADLETEEVYRRLLVYSNLKGRCIGQLKARGEYSSDLLADSQDEYIRGREAIGLEDDSSAMDWIRFIVSESFQPVFADPAEELERLKRYLITASLVAAESGALDDEQ